MFPFDLESDSNLREKHVPIEGHTEHKETENLLFHSIPIMKVP
jgi:hypothetical protein